MHVYKGYHIVVTGNDADKVANVKKGRRVHFAGTPHAYNSQRAGAIIGISNAQLQ